jgi:hypothetical protein
MTNKQRWSIIVAVLVIVSGGYLLAYVNTVPAGWWVLPTQIFTAIAMVAAGMVAFIFNIDV